MSIFLRMRKVKVPTHPPRPRGTSPVYTPPPPLTTEVCTSRRSSAALTTLFAVLCTSVRMVSMTWLKPLTALSPAATRLKSMATIIATTNVMHPFHISRSVPEYPRLKLWQYLVVAPTSSLTFRAV